MSDFKLNWIQIRQKYPCKWDRASVLSDLLATKGLAAIFETIPEDFVDAVSFEHNGKWIHNVNLDESGEMFVHAETYYGWENVAHWWNAARLLPDAYICHLGRYRIGRGGVAV